MATKYIQRDTYSMVHYYGGETKGYTGPEYKALCGERGFTYFDPKLIRPRSGICQPCIRASQDARRGVE